MQNETDNSQSQADNTKMSNRPHDLSFLRMVLKLQTIKLA